MVKNILITGANGQLGSEIRRLAGHYPDIKFFFTDMPELDITNKAAVRFYIREHKIDGLINCAAYTAVDQAEEERELAFEVNVKGPETLSLLAEECSFGFVHISTDYVFDGENFSPYTENDLPNPVGTYGKTKLEGERAVLWNKPESVIIRTSWLYSSFGKNFLKTMLGLMRERSEIGVVCDQVGTPTYAADLAHVSLKILLDRGFEKKAGIFHFSNEGVASWYDFAQAIRELTGAACIVNPLKTSEFPTKTKRPPYSVLDKTKIKQAFSLKIPYWRDSLKECLALTGQELGNHITINQSLKNT